MFNIFKYMNQSKKLLKKIIKIYKLEPSSLSEKIILKGTELFSGNSGNHDNYDLPLDPFKYKGQSSSTYGTIVFFSNEESAAEGYSFCFIPGKSWVNKFEVIKDLVLIDLNFNVNKEYFEVEDVAKTCMLEVNKYGIDGIFISYNGNYELALCDPSKKLKHIASKKCIGSSRFNQWKFKF